MWATHKIKQFYVRRTGFAKVKTVRLFSFPKQKTRRKCHYENKFFQTVYCRNAGVCLPAHHHAERRRHHGIRGGNAGEGLHPSAAISAGDTPRTAISTAGRRKRASGRITRAIGGYNGQACYCIVPGVSQQTGDTLTQKDENFWDNYPDDYNDAISPYTIKLFIGRIMQYGYTGNLSTSWRSNNAGADDLCNLIATQLLIWEAVIGERDDSFNKLSTGSKESCRNN